MRRPPPQAKRNVGLRVGGKQGSVAEFSVLQAQRCPGAVRPSGKRSGSPPWDEPRGRRGRGPGGPGPGPQQHTAMLRWALAAALGCACVNAQCAETCQTCKSASSTDCEVCSDGYVLIDEDLDGFGTCEPLSVDWDFNAGACSSSLSDHVGMASDLEGCWALCSERYGANLKAIDLGFQQLVHLPGRLRVHGSRERGAATT